MESNKELIELEEMVSKGLKKAYAKMIDFKSKNNTPIIVSDDGKILELTPSENIRNHRTSD